VGQKGFAPILIFLILAGVVILVYFGIFYKSSAQPSPQPTSSDTPTPTAFATPDLTAGWVTKTYSIYQVKYPTDLAINEREGSIISISKWGPTQIEGTELFDGFSVTFQPKELPGVSPIDYANSQIEEMLNTGISELLAGPTAITVNGYKGVTYTGQGLGKYKHFILASNDNLMLMQISLLVSDPGNIGFQETVDQIISTFSFLD
jgi:hypothetical protein